MGMVWAKEMSVVRKNCIMNSGKGYRRPSEKGYAGKQIQYMEETSDRIDQSNGLKTVLSGKAPEALKAAMSALSMARTSFSGFLRRFCWVKVSDDSPVWEWVLVAMADERKIDKRWTRSRGLPGDSVEDICFSNKKREHIGALRISIELKARWRLWCDFDRRLGLIALIYEIKFLKYPLDWYTNRYIWGQLLWVIFWAYISWSISCF